MNQGQLDAVAARVRAALEPAAPNYENMLTHIIDSYKKCKNLNARDKHEIEFLLVVSDQIGRVQDAAVIKIRKQIMLYVQLMQNGWSYATKYIKK